MARGGFPDDSAPADVELSDEAIELPEVIGVEGTPINEWELATGNEVYQRSIHFFMMEAAHWDLRIRIDSIDAGHQRHESSYVRHGNIICEDYNVTPTEECLDKPIPNYYQMDSLPRCDGSCKVNAEMINGSLSSEPHHEFAQ